MVIGVGVLILMLVLEPVPMLRGVNRVAHAWLALVLLLIAALASIESAVHLHTAPRLRRTVFFIGIVFLLAVPAVFAAMVVSVENPNVWQSVGQAPPPWPGRLTVHYLMRFAHVLGASVVFAAGLLLLWGRPPRSYTARLRRWMETAIWFQVMGGVALLASLPHGPPWPVIILIVIAVGAAAAVAKTLADHDDSVFARERRGRIAASLVVLLTGMLLARQFLQDQVVTPINRQLRAEADHYRLTLAKAERRKPSLSTTLPVRSNPAVVYCESCSFCHGGVGNGGGTEAFRLGIPPEDLTAVRSTSSYLNQVLRNGVPGTAMPMFDYYTGDELKALIRYLHSFGLRDRPELLPATVTPVMRGIGRDVFEHVCADCHGQGGRSDGPQAVRVSPRPPDFTHFTVSPERAFAIISSGYPGTAMRSFITFPEELRWALVQTVEDFYRPSRVE